jgi:phosphoesterase RecJ-like protein
MKPINEINQVIQEFDSIVIYPHFRPDGDCIGSAVGLKEILKANYPEKDIFISGELSDFTKYIIPELDSLSEDQIKESLSIAVDTAAADRVYDQRFKLGKKIIKIDHHEVVDSYGDVNYEDTTSPAAAQMIIEFAIENNLEIPKSATTALLFGILTDTGRLKYSGVTAKTIHYVAHLYEVGVDHRALYQYLDRKSEAVARYKGYLLQNYQKTENGVIYFKIQPEHLEEFGVTLDEATNLVNEMSGFDCCPVWVLFAEYEERIVRARIRSRGPAVNQVAGQFDGGGHKMASGANVKTWENSDKLIEALDELVKQYKEQ